MRKYQVLLREVWIRYVYIDADSPKQAIKAVNDGGGREQEIAEYAYTLDHDTWTAKEVTGDEMANEEEDG